MTTMTKEMTSRQSFAIKCASGLDVRGLNLDYDQASSIIESLNDQYRYQPMVNVLIEDGATGTPKAYRPYVKGQRKSRSVRKTTPKVKGESAKDKENRELYEKAHAAGNAAANKCVPTPMQVVEHVNPLDDNSPIKRVYKPTMGGVCGFAWIVIRDGRSSFARWAVKNNKARRSDYHGVMIWGEDNVYNGQSMETKMAYVRAFGQILSGGGVDCYSQSRMD